LAEAKHREETIAERIECLNTAIGLVMPWSKLLIHTGMENLDCELQDPFESSSNAKLFWLKLF
jgi:hypothetical protein